MFLEIFSRLLTLEDYVKILYQNDRKKLWLELESSKDNRASGWKLIASYMSSSRGKEIFSKMEIESLDNCCFPLSRSIIENMKTRGVTINHLEKAIKSECSTRNDLLECLAKLRGIKEGNQLLKEYDDVELEDLKICLTNKYHENDWKVIFKQVCYITGDYDIDRINVTLKEFENIKQKQPHLFPCEVLFDMLYKRKPDLSLLYIYNALKYAKQGSSAKLLVKNIATLLHIKCPKDTR